MKGLEIAREYFDRFGLPMLKTEFADIMPFLCAGLVGSGSECYGFDDGISTDHDFEPGFCLFIPDEDTVDRKTAFRLERAYAKLPKEFGGLKRCGLNPVGGSRHGVIRINDFYTAKLGNSFGSFSVGDWFSIPEYALFEAVNGDVFFDNYGEFSRIRRLFSEYPRDIRLKKLAGNLLLMAQSGQYNYERCLSHNESGAAQLALFDFVNAAMRSVFLLNNAYMPYYKWSFRALRDLQMLPQLADSFEFLISTDNDNSKLKVSVIEDISGLISAALTDTGIIKDACSSLEAVAYSVNAAIGDSNIRNLNILAAV